MLFLRIRSLVTGALLAVTWNAAQANCGSSYCSVNSEFETIGQWTEPGLRIGLRYEQVEQKKARRGTTKIGEDDAPDLPHFPTYNKNDNVTATLDYSINNNWGISATLPFVHLTHERLSRESEHEEETAPDGESQLLAAPLHEGESHGEGTLEKWNYSGMGDVRVVGRYQTSIGAGNGGIRFGLKLPTGATDKRNDEGENAERALQPGSGSTDLLLGAFVNGKMLSDSLSWFAETQVQLPVNEKDNYKSGNEILINAGLRYGFNDTVSALLQSNLRLKSRDRGEEADPDNSGGEFWYVSTGVGLTLGRNFQLFGFVQVPAYQHVKGVQLAPETSYILGMSVRF